MKCEIQRSSYLHCIRRYRRLALGFDMSGDMRCHTDGTPSDADTVYRTQIGIFSYEYMGSVRIIPHEMEVVVQLMGIAPQEYTFHEIQLVHLDRSILQTHCIILPSPQVHVHKSVRFEKVPGLHSLVQIGLRFPHVGGHALPHWLYSIRRGHCLDDTFSKRKFAPMLIHIP